MSVQSLRALDPSSRPLSRRERQVLELLATGASNLRIAMQLGTTVNTVKTHVQHIADKLGTHNRTEAALLARTVLEGT